MDFYCLHHSPAKERKSYMNSFFTSNFIKPIWIESFLPEDPLVENFPKVISEHSANKHFLNKSEISLYLKHQEAFKLIGLKNEIGIILEDDVKIPNFNLYEFCKLVAPEFLIDGDLLFIGSIEGMNIHHETKKIISEPWMKSRCAHCYMVNPSSCDKIIDFISKPLAPFDWQLNYAIESLKLKVYWSVDSVLQMTQINEIKSLLR
jgi:hypothetical protein